MPWKVPIGFAGVGVGELLALIALALMIIERRYQDLREGYKSTRYILATFGIFIALTAVGGLFATLYFEPSLRSVFGVLRQAMIMLLIIPLVRSSAAKRPRNKYAEAMVIGALIAIAVNVAFWVLRISKTISLPGQNELGIALVIALPWAMALSFKAERKATQLIWTVATAAIIGATIWTWSKAAWISAAIVVLVIFSVVICTGEQRHRDSMRNALLPLLVIALTSGLLARNTISWIIRTEITSSSGAGSNKQRIMASAAGFKVGESYPIGVGTAHFKEATEEMQVPLLWRIPDPHSSIAQAVTYAGYFGLCALIIGYLQMARQVASGVRREPVRVAAGLAVLVGGFLLMLTSGILLTQPPLWAASALAMANPLQNDEGD